jgi:predicted ATP-dependent Lon-type protease
MKLKSILFLVAIVMGTSLQAQKNFMKEADTDFRNESYFDASQKYLKAAAKLKKRDEKALAYLK